MNHECLEWHAEPMRFDSVVTAVAIMSQ